MVLGGAVCRASFVRFCGRVCDSGRWRQGGATFPIFYGRGSFLCKYSSANDIDHYKVLGVSRRASRQEIMMRFISLASKSPDNMQQLAQSTDVLLNTMKRMDYDNHKEVYCEEVDADLVYKALRGQIFMNSIYLTNLLRMNPLVGLDFRSGTNVYCEIDVEFEEALTGVTRLIEFDAYDRCKACKGTGSESAKLDGKCHYCNNGATFIDWKGMNPVRCPACSGTGSIVKKPCSQCGGSGLEGDKKRKTVNVKIPKGVESGANLRVARKGNAGERGGPSGDLVILVSVGLHSFFRREGDDLHVDVPLTLVQAILGTEVTILLPPKRKIKVAIPPGVNHGDVFKVLGVGMAPSLFRQLKSALVVHAKIVIPKNLTEYEKSVLRELQ